MACFMTQELFNLCAVSAAHRAANDGRTLKAVCREIALDFSTHFQDEGLAEDLLMASSEITDFFNDKCLPTKSTDFATFQIFNFKTQH